MRNFDTGATRDTDEGKLDFEGFLSHDVLIAYGKYMNKNRVQADGKVRDSDNWQKGIPQDAYMKSGFRHFMDMWNQHRTRTDPDYLVESACALLFNVMGYLHEELKKQEVPVDLFTVTAEDVGLQVPTGEAPEGYQIEIDKTIEIAVFNFAATVLHTTLPWGHPIYRCDSTDNLMFDYPKVPGHRQYVTVDRLIKEGLLQ